MQFVNTQKSDILLYLYHKEGKNTEEKTKKNFSKVLDNFPKKCYTISTVKGDDLPSERGTTMAIKLQEKMALARQEAYDAINLEASYQIGTAEYVVPTQHGYVKVKLTAVKDAEFDPEAEQELYEFEKAEKEKAAERRKAEAEAKKAANIAKKAKAKAEKEAKEKAEA